MIKHLIIMLLTTSGLAYAQPVNTGAMLLPPPPPTLRDPMRTTPPAPPAPGAAGIAGGVGVQSEPVTIWVVRQTDAGVWQVHHEGEWLGRGQRLNGERIERISERRMTLRGEAGTRDVMFTRNYMRMHKEQE